MKGNEIAKNGVNCWRLEIEGYVINLWVPFDEHENVYQALSIHPIVIHLSKTNLYIFWLKQSQPQKAMHSVFHQLTCKIQKQAEEINGLKKTAVRCSRNKFKLAKIIIVLKGNFGWVRGIWETKRFPTVLLPLMLMMASWRTHFKRDFPI